jgi:hypothetical protein
VSLVSTEADRAVHVYWTLRRHSSALPRRREPTLEVGSCG